MHNFQDIDKIDAHVHVNSHDTSLCEQAKTDNFKIFSVNTDYPDFPSVEEQNIIAIKLLQTYPNQFAFASTFRMNGWEKSDWQEKIIRHLDHTLNNGAVAVKVWKNIGMEIRNKQNEYVMIDDPGFDKIFLHLTQKDIPLICHTAEPKDCWLPLEDIALKFVREYFSSHPQYYARLHPEIPSYEEQVAARDRLLTKNKQLHFSGAHLASLEWSIEEMSRFLDRFPLAVVDMAERMMYLQHHASQDYKKVRNFMIEYQDRILYGTDLVQSPESDSEKFKKEVHGRWLDDWNFLGTDKSMHSSEFKGTFKGLSLPLEVIEKIYRSNALRVFPKAWSKNK